MNTRGLLLSTFILLFGIAAEVPLRERFGKKPNISVEIESLPRQLGEWRGKDAGDIETSSLGILRLSRYIRRTYTHPKYGSLFIYIGYWETQSADFQAAKHSPIQCLPAHGWKLDYRPSIRKNLNSEINQQVNINLLLGQIQDQKSLVSYFFFHGKEYFSDEKSSLIRIVKQAIKGQRIDGGIVEILGPLPVSGTEQNVFDGVNNFLDQLLPELDQRISRSE